MNTDRELILCQREGGNCALTVEATPPSDVTRVVVSEDGVSSRDTSSTDAVAEGDGGRHLDQGDVITAKETHTRADPSDLQLLLPAKLTEVISACSCSSQTCCVLPDEEGVPLLVHDDVSGAHEHSTLLCLDQVVLSHDHSVLPATTARRRREEYEETITSRLSTMF